MANLKNVNAIEISNEQYEEYLDLRARYGVIKNAILYEEDISIDVLKGMFKVWGMKKDVQLHLQGVRSIT